MPPPPVLDRPNIPPEPPLPSDQHTKISEPSEFIYPSKSSIENHDFPPISASPAITVHSGAGLTSVESSQPVLSFGYVPASFQPPQRPQFLLQPPSSLFTQAPAIISQIPCVSASVGLIASPICDRLPETIPMVPFSYPTPFISDGNFRSKNPATGFYSSSISGAGSTYFFKSSSHSLRPNHGRILPPSISGFRPTIVNSQIQAPTRSSAGFSAQSALLLPESARNGPCSVFSNLSPASGGSPTDDPRVNSGESSNSVTRVDSAVNNIGVIVNPSPSVSVLPTVSFQDVISPPSPRTAKKSFEDMMDSIEEMPEPTMLDGKPGIRFPETVISSWAEPFKYALVGKISGNRTLVPNPAIYASIANGTVSIF